MTDKVMEAVHAFGQGVDNAEKEALKRFEQEHESLSAIIRDDALSRYFGGAQTFYAALTGEHGDFAYENARSLYQIVLNSSPTLPLSDPVALSQIAEDWADGMDEIYPTDADIAVDSDIDGAVAVRKLDAESVKAPGDMFSEQTGHESEQTIAATWARATGETPAEHEDRVNTEGDSRCFKDNGEAFDKFFGSHPTEDDVARHMG